METVDGQNTPSPPVAERASAWKLGGLSWRTLAGRVWHEIYEGALLTHAAALSFYFLLALFPLLLFLMTAFGYFAESGSELRASLLALLSRVVPPSAATLIYTTVDEIGRDTGSSGGLPFGLVTALWLASSGVAALGDSLNAMYGVRESRPFWRVRATSVGLTVALAALIISALMMLFYGGEIGTAAADYFNHGARFTIIWSVVQVPVALAFVLLAFALIYYYTPNLYDQKWYWITPGSIAGVALWVLVSFLFRLYLRRFDTYGSTYGSLGGVIVLVLWFYLTGVAILLGGKINAEIEAAAAAAGVPEAKHHGEKTADD